MPVKKPRRTYRPRDLARSPRLLELLRAEPAEPCRAALTPCPYIGCRWHLYAEFRENGSLRIHFPEVPPDRMDQLPETCLHRAVSNGPLSWYQIGRLQNDSPSAAQQVFLQISPAKFAHLK